MISFVITVTMMVGEIVVLMTGMVVMTVTVRMLPMSVVMAVIVMAGMFI